MSSQNVNRVTVTGNLAADPALKRLDGGGVLCRLRLAVTERRRDPDTDAWAGRANYFDVVAWGPSAETCDRFLRCGSRVAVDGRLRWHDWTDEHQQRRQTVEIVADHVEFLSPRDPAAAPPPAATPAPASVGGGEEIPF